MQDYWSYVAPPLDTMVAGFLGYKPKKRPGGTKKSEVGDLGDLLRMFPGGSIQ